MATCQVTFHLLNEDQSPLRGGVMPLVLTGKVLAAGPFPSDQNLFEDSRRAGVDIETVCGGFGRCSKCRVWIAEGEVTPVTDAERRYLSERELGRGFRLSCQVFPKGDLVVLVPEASNNIQSKVKLDLGKELDWRDPYVVKRAVSIDGSGASEKEELVEQVVRKLSSSDGMGAIKLSHLRDLTTEDLGGEEVVTGVCFGGRIVAIERGNTTAYNYGVAVDIGTTTLAAYLTDLNSATVIDAEACTNGQRAWGADVVSRINHALFSPGGLAELRQRVIDDVNGLISELCRRNGIGEESIYRVTLVGNTAMHHFFFDLDVSSLGLAPYTPRWLHGTELSARKAGLRANPVATAYFLPLIGGFVGADTTGVILSTEMWSSDRLSLAVDIGTNGETVLGCKGEMLCSSNAAGPAFEGGEITFGMRAVPGAIERVRLRRDGGLRPKTIGNLVPRGICGSGVIDLLALLLDTGIVTRSGRMLPPDRLPETVPDPLRQRLARVESGVRFYLVTEEESTRGEPVYFTDADVRQVQLASGAIAAARHILLKEIGRQGSDIEQVFVAGAFGNHINPHSAARIGLIPVLRTRGLKYVGNAAGDGAKMALTSSKHLELAHRIHELVQHVELAGREDYMDMFMESMAFPGGR